MADNTVNLSRENLVVCADDVNCSEINFLTLPSGGSTLKAETSHCGNDLNIESEACERKKKTRRGKPRRRNPYNKETNEVRGKGKSSNRRLNSRYTQRQPVAPNNTNQFLMEDHNDLQDLDINQILAVNVNKSSEGNSASVSGICRPPRVRDSSFTSADSDQEQFYSSPEDESEFLTKDFVNTYQDLHVETLASLSKTELIEKVLELEEKVDVLEKRCGTKTNKVEGKEGTASEDSAKIKSDIEMDNNYSILQLQQELAKLQRENERLRDRRRSSSLSSVDSESDSSSTSSRSDLSDKGTLCSPGERKTNAGATENNVNGDSNSGQDVIMINSENLT